jgi:hypothetical protein
MTVWLVIMYESDDFGHDTFSDVCEVCSSEEEAVDRRRFWSGYNAFGYDKRQVRVEEHDVSPRFKSPGVAAVHQAWQGEEWASWNPWGSSSLHGKVFITEDGKRMSAYAATHVEAIELMEHRRKNAKLG